MNKENVEIGTEVVRSKGDYVVGRIGKIVAIDSEKNRAQVDWNSVKTWVSFNALEPTNIPYKINEGFQDTRTRRFINPKYQRV